MCNLFSVMRTASLCFLMFLLSCDDDDEVKDNQNPSITITSPSTEGILKGTVMIKANVVETDLKDVKVLVDGVLVGSGITNAIEVPWDTKLVQDGVHTIKVLATDNNNNVAESAVTVDVLNSILTFSVPEGTLTSVEALWYFITDKQGNLLGVKQCEDGGSVTFDTPENYVKGQTVELHRMYVHTGNRSHSVQSYRDFKPGSYVYKPYFRSYTPPPSVGNYSVTVNTLPYWNVRPQIVGDEVSGWSGTGNSEVYSLDINLIKANTSLLVSVRDGDNVDDVPRYGYMPEVSTGGSSAFNYDQLTPMDLHNVPLGADYTYVASDVSVFPIAGDYSKRYYLGMFGGETVESVNNLKLFYPGQMYPEYSTGIYCSNDDMARYYYKVGTLPTEFKELAATVTSFTGQDRTLNLSTTGAFDVMFIGAHEFKEIDGNFYSFNWTYAAGGESNYALSIPQIPAEILEQYPILNSFSTKKFDSITLYEYVGIEGYDDFLAFDFSSDATNIGKYKEALGVQFFSYDGVEISGRKRSHEDLKRNFYLP